jgi:hypothetical protein
MTFKRRQKPAVIDGIRTLVRASPQPTHFTDHAKTSHRITSSGPDMNQLLKKTPINEHRAVQYTKPKQTPLH